MSGELSRQSHRDLTVTATGCHVWRGSTYAPCHAHGTPGCCLIRHQSAATQRAFDRPRCVDCGRFMREDRLYEARCLPCSIEYDPPEYP